MGQSTQSARTPPLQYFFFPDPRELSYEVLEVLGLHHAHLIRFPDRHSLPLHSIIRAVWGCLQRVVERGLRSKGGTSIQDFLPRQSPPKCDTLFHIPARTITALQCLWRLLESIGTSYSYHSPCFPLQNTTICRVATMVRRDGN